MNTNRTSIRGVGLAALTLCALALFLSGWRAADAQSQPPAQVGNLAVASGSSTQVSLTWADVANETGYRVERRLGDSSTWATAGTASAGATTFNDTNGGAGFGENVPYSWRVVATNGAGDAAPSAPAFYTQPLAAAKTYSTSPTAVIAVPSPLPTRPARGGYVYDPDFGTKIIRVSSEDLSGGQGTSYSYWRSINANNTKILESVNGSDMRIHTFNPTTHQVEGPPLLMPYINGNTPAHGPGSPPIWDHDDPDKLYCATEKKIYVYSVQNNSYTLYADLSALSFPNGGNSGIVQWQAEDKPNPRRFAFQFTHWNGSSTVQYGVGVFEKNTSGTGGQFIYTEAEPTNASVNEATISKNGRYLVVFYDRPGGLDSKVVDLNASGQPSQTIADGQDQYALGHYDLGQSLGYGADNYLAAFIRQNLANYVPSSGTVLRDLSHVPEWGAYHVSARADDETWIEVSTHNNATNKAFWNEIFFVKSDGSGQVRRLLHHFMQYQNYYDSPRANVSSDGRWVAFASNWGAGGSRLDLYVAPVPVFGSGGGGSGDPVVWTSQVNVTTGPNGAITKTNANAFTSALSQQKLFSGEGSVEFTPNTAGMGNDAVDMYLKDGASTPNYFRFVVGQGYAQVYQNGTYQASTSFTVGDVLKMAVTSSGAIKYYKNGAEVSTSTAAVTYPVRALFETGWSAAPGVGLSGATVSGFTNAEPVTWSNVTNATAGSNGSITKNTGGFWLASAHSSQSISGDGFLECVLNNNGSPSNYVINVGLNSGSLSPVEYYWAVASGYAQPYVNGVYQASTTVTTGDVLKIAVEGSAVKFYKNGTLVYTSSAAPSFPLKAYWDSSFDGVGLTSATVGY